MIPPDLLEILCCPETRQRVLVAPAQLLEAVAKAVRGGGLKAENGEPVTEPPTSGLVREDGKFLYPVRDGIPIMLIQERIPVPGAAEAGLGGAEAGSGGADFVPAAAVAEPAEPVANDGVGSDGVCSDDEVQGDGDPDHHQVEPDAGS